MTTSTPDSGNNVPMFDVMQKAAELMTSAVGEGSKSTAKGDPLADRALRQYLQSMQDKALQLDGLVKAVVFLEIEPEMAAARVTIGELAAKLASELFLGLDSVNLPKGTLA